MTSDFISAVAQYVINNPRLYLSNRLFDRRTCTFLDIQYTRIYIEHHFLTNNFFTGMFYINNPWFFLSNRLCYHLFDKRIAIIGRHTFLDMYNVLEHTCILNTIFYFLPALVLQCVMSCLWHPFYSIIHQLLCNIHRSFSIFCDLELYEVDEQSWEMNVFCKCWMFSYIIIFFCDQ